MTPQDHAEEHDELLHAHLAGDVPADDALLVERLARCDACRERLDELRALTALLERVGDEQRRHLAPPPRALPGSERVAATLEALAQGRPVAVPSRRATLWRVGLAAASVVAAGWVVRTLLPNEGGPRDDVMLGTADDQTMTPSGTVADFRAFDWSGRPREATRFELRVWRDGAGDDEAPILDKRITQLPWIPTDEDRSLLEDARAILWELMPIDHTGSPMTARRARARLRD